MSASGFSHSRRSLLLGMTSGVALTHVSQALSRDSSMAMVAVDVHVEGYPTVQAMHWMNDYLQRESSGRLGLRIMHSGQLGRENDTIDLARYGVIDLTRVYIGAVNNAVPETQILALPYLFESTAHMRRVVDGVVGKQVLAAMQKRNLIGLALYDAGPRCFYNNQRDIHEPHDLHGLKLRVPVSDIFIELVRTFGGNPTPLAYSDTYSAMQTHLIDGAENNWSSFQSSRHFEVAKFWTQSEHSYAPDILLMSERSFKQLTLSDQELVRYAATQSVQYMRGLWDAAEQHARQIAVAAGTRISEVDRAAFQRIAQPILNNYMRKPELSAMFAAIRAEG